MKSSFVRLLAACAVSISLYSSAAKADLPIVTNAFSVGFPVVPTYLNGRLVPYVCGQPNPKQKVCLAANVVDITYGTTMITDAYLVLQDEGSDPIYLLTSNYTNWIQYWNWGLTFGYFAPHITVKNGVRVNDNYTFLLHYNTGTYPTAYPYIGGLMPVSATLLRNGIAEGKGWAHFPVRPATF